MPDSLYLTSTTIRAGKAVVALGVLESLARHVGRIGVFRPIVDGDGAHDALLGLLTDRFQLPGMGPTTNAHNAGGDRFFTDGMIDVGVLDVGEKAPE